MSYDTPSSHDALGSVRDKATESSIVPTRPSSTPLTFELPLPVGWLDVEAAKVLRRLRHCGYTAYLVGGCVRDLLLGRYPKDFDIATSALPREVKRSFSNCRLIGRRFRLAHIIFQQSIVEVATFRRDPSVAFFEEDLDELEPPSYKKDPRLHGKSFFQDGVDLNWRDAAPRSANSKRSEEERGGRTASQPNEAELPVSRADQEMDGDEDDLLIRSDNVFGTPQEDALRRDFTVNGLFFDVSTSTLIDWSGGMDDIEARVIRTIGAPEIRFREDPVRMLRAVKFAASLGFDIEEKTWEAMCEVAPDLSRSAPPRLLEEILRMMRGGQSQSCFRLMSRSGLLDHVLPELAPIVSDELESELSALDQPSFDRESEPIDAGPSQVGDDLVAAGGEDLKGARAEEIPASEGAAGPDPVFAGLLPYLDALDQVDQTREPFPNHLLLAILCLVPVMRSVSGRGKGSISEFMFRQAGSLIDELGSRLRIARRDRERTRLVLMGFAKVTWLSERGSSASALSRKSYYCDAVVLFALHCLALDSGQQDLARFARKVQPSHELACVLQVARRRFNDAGLWRSSVTTGSEKNRTSSRRRRSRRRRRKSASVQAEEAPSRLSNPGKPADRQTSAAGRAATRLESMN